MQNTTFFKANEGIDQISISQQSQATMIPWLTGTQPIYGENFTQLKSLCGNCADRDDQMSGKVPANSAKEASDNAKSLAQDNKCSGKGQKTLQNCSSISLQSPLEYQGRFGQELSQSMACSNHSYADQCYGLYATYGAQAMLGRMLLPPNLTADSPVYVNAKQYHGIVRRRQARAKAEMQNTLMKARRPYLHESRHRHAMRRARGSGGRFLNTKKESNVHQGENSKENFPNTLISTSPSSESGNRNSRSGGPGLSGSEVTSIYSRDDTNRYQFIDHLYPSSYHRLSEMMNRDHGISSSNKSGCRDLVKV